MSDLEKLAHHSAASARASLAGIPIPPAPRRGVSRRAKTAMAFTGVATVVIALLAFSDRGRPAVDVSGPQTSAPTASGIAGETSPDNQTPYFEFDVPDGWVLGVIDGSDARSVNATFAFGAGTTDEPFASAGLMISVIQVPVDEDLGDYRNSDSTVRGLPARVDISDTGVSLISWRERHDLVVGMSSKSYTPDQLIPIADGLTIDGFDVSLPSAPDGLRLVTVVGITNPNAPRTVDSWSMFAKPEPSTDGPGTPDHMFLQATPGGIGALEMVRLSAETDPADVTVRGLPGITYRTNDGSGVQRGSLVAWFEDGELFVLDTFGPDDPIAVANTLRRIDRARFEELLSASPRTTIPPNAATGSDPEGPRGPGTTIEAP